MAAGFESCKVNASNVVSLKLDESVLEAYSGEVRTVCMAMRSDWICVMAVSYTHLATIVAGIVAKDGLDGLVISTILAGVFLILMGICHFGSLIKFIPYTITTGFTSGIAVTIVIGQLKDFFGVVYPDGVKPIETTEKLKAFVENIATINTDAVIVGVVSLVILIISPMIFKKIPGSLLAVIAGILMVKCLPLQVATIGNLYTISNACLLYTSRCV